VLHFCDNSFFFSPVKRTVEPADLPVEQPIKFELLVNPALHSQDVACLMLRSRLRKATDLVSGGRNCRIS
jgi:hypothetical protein